MCWASLSIVITNIEIDAIIDPPECHLPPPKKNKSKTKENNFLGYTIDIEHDINNTIERWWRMANDAWSHW